MQLLYFLSMLFCMSAVMGHDDIGHENKVILNALEKANLQTGNIVNPTATVIKFIDDYKIKIEDLQMSKMYEKVVEHGPEVAKTMVLPAIGVGVVSLVSEPIIKQSMDIANKHLGPWMQPLTSAVSIMSSCIIIEDFIFSSLGLADLPGKHYLEATSCAAFYTAFVGSIAYDMHQDLKNNKANKQ